MLPPGCEPAIRPFPPSVEAALVLVVTVELLVTVATADIAAGGAAGEAFAGGPLNGFTTKINPEIRASPTSTRTE